MRSWCVRHCVNPTKKKIWSCPQVKNKKEWNSTKVAMTRSADQSVWIFNGVFLERLKRLEFRPIFCCFWLSLISRGSGVHHPPRWHVSLRLCSIAPPTFSGSETAEVQMVHSADLLGRCKPSERILSTLHREPSEVKLHLSFWSGWKQRLPSGTGDLCGVGRP